MPISVVPKAIEAPPNSVLLLTSLKVTEPYFCFLIELDQKKWKQHNWNITITKFKVQKFLLKSVSWSIMLLNAELHWWNQTFSITLIKSLWKSCISPFRCETNIAQMHIRLDSAQAPKLSLPSSCRTESSENLPTVLKKIRNLSKMLSQPAAYQQLSLRKAKE